MSLHCMGETERADGIEVTNQLTLNPRDHAAVCTRDMLLRLLVTDTIAGTHNLKRGEF